MITYNGTVEEEGYLTGILQGTDEIMPEEAGDSRSGDQRSADTYGIESTVKMMQL